MTWSLSVGHSQAPPHWPGQSTSCISISPGHLATLFRSAVSIRNFLDCVWYFSYFRVIFLTNNIIIRDQWALRVSKTENSYFILHFLDFTPHRIHPFKYLNSLFAMTYSFHANCFPLFESYYPKIWINSNHGLFKLVTLLHHHCTDADFRSANSVKV